MLAACDGSNYSGPKRHVGSACRFCYDYGITCNGNRPCGACCALDSAHMCREPVRRRKREACTSCYAAKQKCDRQSPCLRCKVRGTRCVYAEDGRWEYEDSEEEYADNDNDVDTEHEHEHEHASAHGSLGEGCTATARDRRDDNAWSVSVAPVGGVKLGATAHATHAALLDAIVASSAVAAALASSAAAASSATASSSSSSSTISSMSVPASNSQSDSNATSLLGLKRGLSNDGSCAPLSAPPAPKAMRLV